MSEQQAHMVEQVIKYSDGTETVIKYRGVIVNGVLISEKVDPMSDEDVKPEEAEAAMDAEEAAHVEDAAVDEEIV